MDFLKTISVAASGLRAQSARMRIISENVANADSTADRPGVDPYRRKIATFDRRFDRELDAQTVQIGKVARDQKQFRTKFDPSHPAANPVSGEVMLPNVETTIEMMDMREAQRSYEANLNVIGATRRMLQRTLELLRA
ncbi:MAG: flagellar basal body rod protein FlgC [Beijerinckiaceae bacterium]